MSLLNNGTALLWKEFMTRRKEIRYATGTALYSLQNYDAGYFERFNPANEFEKWATVEVPAAESIPEGMERFTLPGGLYAVFVHRGSNSDTRTFEYIFGTWLPGSDYVVDARPHFEVLDEKYKNNSPDSEEEIWVPVKLR